MKLQFDPHQRFQLDAVSAVMDLFDGQPLAETSFSPVIQPMLAEMNAGVAGDVLGVGNRLTISLERLRANTRAVQARNGIPVPGPSVPLEAWTQPAGEGLASVCPHFSVEMETGTGKTYVYLRTIYELATRYRFRKFVIVVPSVAIREGTWKNLEITRDHFSGLYNGLPAEAAIYDAKRVSSLRGYATSNHVQILVINIDAFRKNFSGTDEEHKSNVMFKENDRLSGRQPIEFVRSVRPIVIIDEPQSVDTTEKSQDAILALNPLCTLRYSATHKNPYNLVYRLDPVRAFELRLVKKIVVAQAQAVGGASAAFVKVEDIDNAKGIKAKLRINARLAGGTKQKTVTVKLGSDLHELSGEHLAYKDRYEVTEISAEPGNAFVAFANGSRLSLGEEQGGMHDDVWRMQIKQTIRQHLKNELLLRERGIKVLSLFFIDRVANYRALDDDGNPVPGKFATAFEEAFRTLAKEPAYAGIPWLTMPIEKLHDGYFAQDKGKRGGFKDTSGSTQADDDVYNKIMRNKEQLLSQEEPLRFIFSHSALREGWDNPNVFQICMLREVGSETERRQTIGRGLRLPVDDQGRRVHDERSAPFNKLFVVANESYESFARGLQEEYQRDCGVAFGKVTEEMLAGLVRIVDGQEVPITSTEAAEIRQALEKAGMVDAAGTILPAFDPSKPGFVLPLPEDVRALEPDIIDFLNKLRIENHVEPEREEPPKSRLRKEKLLDPAFKELWDRIKPRTTYRVEFQTEELLRSATRALKNMEKIESAKVVFTAGSVDVTSGGIVPGSMLFVSDEKAVYGGPLPDILAFLQNETRLSRGTIARALVDSGRLGDVFIDPQRFLDQSAAALRNALNAMVVEGIQYERLPESNPDAVWEMVKFQEEELIDYLRSIPVKLSIYTHVAYDSEVEHRFAKELDAREDIELFVKLPDWFNIDTPVGTYNPDWAIVKKGDPTVYLIRETKGTTDRNNLRPDESIKVRCGEKHFAALDVDYKLVTKTADI